MASAYDFAEQLLTSQRKFAENVIEATEPPLGAREDPAANESPEGREDPAHGEGPAARKGSAK